ncbi:NAD(P)H-hydrate epimerase [Elusimicrobium posterum]|uniref:NAD(P)H-hydrate epimerase n=1 Tax=Elusimicrobium posterum TaxID=3116653 RepID=UPI003C74D8B6
MKTVSISEMREIENLAMTKYGINEDLLMEHAGRSMAEDILNNFLPDDRESKDDKKVIVVCGYGGNGGDGLVCARYLIERGVQVYCYIIKPAKEYKVQVMKNLKRAFFSHLSVKEIESAADLEELKNSANNAFLIVDCLLGIGFEGEPRGFFKDAINIINAAHKTVLSADGPSGLNADNGKAGETVIKANTTYSFGFIKNGFLKEEARPYVGEIKVLPIGLPAQLL